MRVIYIILLFSSVLINLRANANIINANKLIDLVIDGIKSKVSRSLISIPLPDEHQKIVVPLGLFNLTGDILAKNGTLAGLSALDRLGNATFQVIGQNTSVNLPLGVDTLTFNYDAEIIILNLMSTTAQIVGTVVNLTINSDLSFDPDGNLSLKQFAIEEFQDILVAVHGNGIYDKIAQPLTNMMITLARSRIKAELTNIMETVIGPMFEMIH